MLSKPIPRNRMVGTRVTDQVYSEIQALAMEHDTTFSRVVEYLVVAGLVQIKTPETRANGSQAPHDVSHVDTNNNRN